VEETVKDHEKEATFPAASATCPETVWVPFERDAGTKENPPAVAFGAGTAWPSSRTAAEAGLTPLVASDQDAPMRGVDVVAVEPGAGAWFEIEGGWVSTVMATGDEGAEVPDALDAVAVKE
jgi:hypothetical protein